MPRKRCTGVSMKVETVECSHEESGSNKWEVKEPAESPPEETRYVSEDNE